MPPNTILLSAMMRELSARPGFTEALLAQLEGVKAANTKRGPALLTPALADELRKRILGGDWAGLDRFPGWTMRAINPAVDTAAQVLAKHDAAKHDAAKHDVAENDAAATAGSPAPALTREQARAFLDLGPYALDRAESVSLNTPSALPPFTTDGIVSGLGGGVSRGDGPNELAAGHAESERLANVLNRLAASSAMNASNAGNARGAEPFAVQVGDHVATSPQALMEALTATGHEVTVNDARYFANFGHLHYQRPGSRETLDVMMPFWLDTQIAVPEKHGWLRRFFFRPRPLLVPVSHAEYEWHIRARGLNSAGAAHPRIDADVSYYFGIDGKSEWRTMDTLDQAWVLKRNAHTYIGAQAIEVTRLAGQITVAMLHQHARRPSLPFGGYYALGVCQDGVSAIEKKLTGRVTLFPNTADSSLFDDPRDAEVNRLMQAIPKDRAGVMPEPERVFGSLPVDASESSADFATITLPGLADDLAATHEAWRRGTLRRTQGWLFSWTLSFAAAAVLAAAAALITRKFLSSR